MGSPKGQIKSQWVLEISYSLFSASFKPSLAVPMMAEKTGGKSGSGVRQSWIQILPLLLFG